MVSNGRAAESELQVPLTTALSSADNQEKCRKLTALIDSAHSGSLVYLFQMIMNDLFNDRPHKWGLSRNNHIEGDYAAIKQFLGPNGAIFRMIQKMQNDGLQTRCPMSTSLTDHLTSKFPSPRTNGTLKSSCAFEAYFSYFASFITKPAQNYPIDLLPSYIRTPSQSDAQECLYFDLLSDYLTQYFPTNIDVTLPTLKANIQGDFKIQKRSPYAFTKSSYLLRHDSSRQPSPAIHNGSRCCDLMAQIFCEFWFDDYRLSQGEDKAKHPAKPAPTENHVKAVRLFVKHVHYFCNAHSEPSLAKRFENDSMFEQVDQSIMNKLQPKLLQFLEFCFNSWPLDRNFRIVLETWLSYIQPWRYRKTTTGINPHQDSVTNVWYPFVHINNQFYTKLFKLSIKRFIRMDIGLAVNSILLYRVAKVYSQPNLVTLIDQAEEATAASSFQTSGNYESYVGPSQHANSFNASEDISVFSSGFTNVVRQLLLVIARALDNAKSNGDSRESDWSSQVVKFFGYNSLSPNAVGGRPELPQDRKKTCEYLQFSMEKFADIYELPIPDLENSPSLSNMDTDMADHIIDESGKKVLTPTGRAQLINNMRKFSVRPRVSNELRPICSYENAFLVRKLYSLSSNFNDVYGKDVEALCKRNDYVGRLFQQVFCHTDDDVSTKPYLSLRFMAHYRNLFYLAFLYFLSLLFNFSFLAVLIYLSLFAFVFVALKAFF